MEKRVFEMNFRGRPLIVETGELAKQAHGAVLVRYGDTVVLSTVCVSNDANILSDFFPLMVLYQEKLYSVGKIPGGFIKREGRPSEAATLAARMIDRPMRPLFPSDFRNEVQVVNTVLSVDPDNSPELAAMFGSSLATSISKVPFNGPIAGVKVGRVDGKLVINPTVKELEESDIDLTVAGTKDAINMVEAGAKEVSEDDMLEALMFGHEAVKELVKFEEKIIKEVGQEKMEYETLEITDELKEEIYSLAKEPLDKAMRIKDKLEKYAAIDKVKEDVVAKFEYENEDLDKDELNELITKVKLCLSEVEYEVFRKIVVKEKKRADGRKMTEIRPISTDIDLLPRTHGSALFTRGETQSLSVVTLGALGEHQVLDGLSPEDEKRFMLHYNFPQFSVGETGRYGAPGRREIGHGALGERALLQVIPSEEEFPYTIRVVSEILESNGSSSQASICAGCMALMAAGVPIKAPVAGIAMGLITDGDDYTILTDIQGMEDHLGDMDFKVAGTKDGICALQMDIKISGITKEILKEALAQAKKARLEILKIIAKQIKEPRGEVSKYAPKTMTFMIDPLKIKDVIGKGGEMITKIILDASNVDSVNDMNAVKVDLEDDGRVVIYHTDQEIIDKTAEMIKNVVKEVEIGKIYTGRVVKIIEELGCFVELWEGCEGLVHISQLSDKRVAKTSDVVSVGDEIIVKATGYKNGKLTLSRKEVLVKDKIKDNKKDAKKITKKEENEDK
ncbi:MAG TPA: polyribonucleotide nucleotidyltransferase [Candidatus Aphodocola excrementigallinarum]|uniref:Polyribonucleotide nucleotidyltransferase n=1 Tax=Candidatus Aphodocola excrementigallinarum TaxID=2840670 RepID=A0A9D1IQ10_9FIRM|nr:polyribonucleotide nucleotidyltransferase [Candidatus Aphodocola excrementigallinarum]